MAPAARQAPKITASGDLHALIDTVERDMQALGGRGVAKGRCRLFSRSCTSRQAAIASDPAKSRKTGFFAKS
jgi:hypothetical protein